MPFPADAIRIDLAGERYPGRHRRGWHSVKVRADELRRLGITPASRDPAKS